MTMPMALPQYAVNLMDRYTRMKSRQAARDRNHELIHQVRRGQTRQLFPNELEFSITFEGTPIANFVDIVAHDMAEGIAPLPSLACVAGKMQTDADQKRAEIKNRIGDQFWRHSRLEIQMLKGADRYVTYGFVPIFVEPDTKCKLPFLHVEDPRNAYYELDRYGRCRVYAKRWLRSVDDLCAMFPEYESLIRMNPQTGKRDLGSRELEYVRWVDDKEVLLMLPERSGLVLGSYEHMMSCTPVVIAERPSEDDSPRGQFDDVIWVQVARAIMSTLALEAAAIAVQAPIAVPSDTDILPVGPHAILQSDNAGDIHKLQLELPSSIFAENAALDNELRVGARYPDARTGGVQASVITGKGVEALLGTFDSQIKGAQMVFKEAFQDATAMCFEMDEVWWPNESKTVAGTLSGSSYEFHYVPSKDIAGRYQCTVTYGFAAGLNPSQSIVTMLQLFGAGLLDAGSTMENLPFSMDAIQTTRKIDVEKSRDALKQGVFALVQSAGQMAAQGQDASPVIQLAVDMIHNLQNGQAVEDAVSSAYQSMEQRQQQEQQEQAAAQQAAGAPPGGPPSPGGGPSGPGGMQDQAPGQAGQPPGGSPTLAQMIVGMRGNGTIPVNQYQIRRTTATGT